MASTGYMAHLQALQFQPRVQAYFTQAFADDAFSHAYLFCGREGSGQLEAALCIASALVCGTHQGPKSETAKRVARGTHPDVHILEPASKVGYLVEQAQSIIEDVVLVPVQAPYKVYILQEAHMLKAQAANALLKTLEEPPGFAIFILLAPSQNAVLPTIASRCQQIPFLTPGRDRLCQMLVAASGASEEEASIALAFCASPHLAQTFLDRSGTQRKRNREDLLRVLTTIQSRSSAELLIAAQALAERIAPKKPAQSNSQQENQKRIDSFLSSAAKKERLQAQKRAEARIAQAQFSELIRIAEVYLHDLLLVQSGITDALATADITEQVVKAAHKTNELVIIKALHACENAHENLARNVDGRLVLEALFLSIKEAI